MRMMKLKTTLSANPPGCKCGCGRFKTIVKGSTAILSYDFKDVDYTLDYDGDGKPDFKQLTLLLRQPNGSDLAWECYDESGSMDSHFSYDELTETIDFTLSSDETGELMTSDRDCPTLWEMAIVTKDDYTIIDPQEPVIVLDSIYNDSKGHGAPTPYAGERTLCSATLVCNN